MASKDFVFSADGHVLEPTDLFRTRLPGHLRERGVWEEDFEIEPLVVGGARVFRRLHTVGFEGWTVSRYRQTSGRTPEGDPERILEDMDADGIDVQLMHPNLSLFGLYTDDHELSIAHARVYNDYIAERFTPYFDRLAPTAPIPLTDIDDAVVEIERVATMGSRAILLPSMSPVPYTSTDLDPEGSSPSEWTSCLLPLCDWWRESQRPERGNDEDRHGHGQRTQFRDEWQGRREAHDDAMRDEQHQPTTDHH